MDLSLSEADRAQWIQWAERQAVEHPLFCSHGILAFNKALRDAERQRDDSRAALEAAIVAIEGRAPGLGYMLPTLRRALGPDPVSSVPLVEQLEAALMAFVDQHGCRLDHNGFCQEHGCAAPCRVHVARELLKLPVPKPSAVQA